MGASSSLLPIIIHLRLENICRLHRGGLNPPLFKICMRWPQMVWTAETGGGGKVVLLFVVKANNGENKKAWRTRFLAIIMLHYWDGMDTPTRCRTRQRRSARRRLFLSNLAGGIPIVYAILGEQASPGLPVV